MTDKVTMVYAQALLDVVGEMVDAEEIVNQSLSIAKVLMDNEDYLKFLETPTVKLDKKLEYIDEAFKEAVSPYVLNFVKLLVKEKRIRQIMGIVKEFKDLTFAKLGISEVFVTSAVPLTEAQTQRLVEKLEKQTNNRVNLICSVDKSLLGGLVIEIGNTQIDSSVKSRISEIESYLKTL